MSPRTFTVGSLSATVATLFSFLLAGCDNGPYDDEDGLRSSSRVGYRTYQTRLFGRYLAEQVGQGWDWLTAPELGGQASAVIEGSFASNSSSRPQQPVTNHLFHRIPVFTGQPTSVVRVLINTYQTFTPALVLSSYDPLLGENTQAWVTPRPGISEASRMPGHYEVTLVLPPAPNAHQKVLNDEFMNVFITDAAVLQGPDGLEVRPLPKVDARCRYGIQILPVSGQSIGGPLFLSESGTTTAPAAVTLPLEDREYAQGGSIFLDLSFAESFVTRASMLTGDETGWPDLAWSGEKPVEGRGLRPHVWAIGQVLSSVAWSIGADSRTFKLHEKATIKQVEVMTCQVEELRRLQALDLRPQKWFPPLFEK